MKHLLFINGRFIDSPEYKKITSPFSGKIVSETAQASVQQLELALEASQNAFSQFKKSSRYIRAKLLHGIAKGLEARKKEIAKSIVDEAGKPLSLAEAEVNRAIMTFTIAAEETKRFSGELIPIDLDPNGRSFQVATSTLVPRGPVLAITPFNFPLNLVAHKVAPALAVGTSVLLKPPPQATGASNLLAEIFLQSAQEASDDKEQIPLAALQVVSAANEVMEKAIKDPRIATLSFTGSDRVGWMLQEKAIKKRVLLELGGNAAVIVHNDADLKRAANRCAFGAYAYAGQICISVQRIYVQQKIYSQFLELFTTEIQKLKVGDPADLATLVGPMIDDRNVERILSWIEEAKKAGGKIILSGKRDGNILYPFLLSDVPTSCKLQNDEAFGPVAVIEAYENLSEAVAKVNQSRFGLQAGVFSESTKTLQYAQDHLDAGGIMLNEIPTYRADNMPYGGMKESGLGREGVKYSMQEFCDWKTIVTWKANA